MDLVLITITAVSLTLAVTMGAVLLRVLREERMRSDARVAMLAEAARESSAPGVAGPAPRPPRRERPTSGDAGVTAQPLFVTTAAESPWLRRAAVAVSLAALVAIGAWVSSHLGSPRAEGEAAAPAPLELLDLQHAREPGMLTISGVVQNPPHGAPLAGIAVSALLFGADGSFLTNGRASLDYVTLGPGDESPFVVRVPVTAAVGRYRVGFRAADGSVVAHVDRRAGGASVRYAPGAGGTSWTR